MWAFWLRTNLWRSLRRRRPCWIFDECTLANISSLVTERCKHKQLAQLWRRMPKISKPQSPRWNPARSDRHCVTCMLIIKCNVEESCDMSSFQQSSPWGRRTSKSARALVLDPTARLSSWRCCWAVGLEVLYGVFKEIKEQMGDPPYLRINANLVKYLVK